MTVGELIEQLQGYDSNTIVYFSEPTHDYWRNVLVHEVRNVGHEQVKYSEYHRALQICSYDEDSGDTQSVLVID